MKNNRSKIIAISSIGIAVLVLVLGITYAFMTFNREGSKFSTLVTGDIYMHYNESNNINLENVVPRNDYDPNAYFEFTIKGKNTNTVHDIIYDIKITDGSNHDTRTVRLAAKFLKFRLVEVNGETETVIVDNKRYDNLYQDRIWIDRVAKNTTAEVNKTYRLYVWIDERIRLGNTESADYDLDTWNNDIYASIKVNVTGDFTEKTLTPDYLRVSMNDQTIYHKFLYSDLEKGTIEKIVFTDTNEVPSDVLGSFDVSEKQNGSIMAWYYDLDENDLYELYIGGDGGVYANPNSSFLFFNCWSLTEVELTYFYVTSDVTDLTSIFSNCWNLTNLNISHWDTSNVTSMDNMFSSARNLTDLDLSNWDTSNVTSMDSMFAGLVYTTSVGDLSNWNTSKVTIMRGMFSGANSLTSIGDINNWDTSNVISMSSMFSGANSLTSLDLSKWDTSSVTDMSNMFGFLEGLTSLNLSNWNTSNVTDMSNMFGFASVLTSLDLSSASFASVIYSNNMFISGSSLLKIMVKDQEAYNFIYPKLSAEQKLLLTIKS